MVTTIEKAPNRDIVPATDRQVLIAYLKYAVEDVAQINQTSASLLRLAIAYLEGRSPNGETSRPQ